MGLSKIQIPGEAEGLLEEAENKSPMKSHKRQENNMKLDSDYLPLGHQH